jgi:hypothetical protein
VFPLAAPSSSTGEDSSVSSPFSSKLGSNTVILGVVELTSFEPSTDGHTGSVASCHDVGLSFDSISPVYILGFTLCARTDDGEASICVKEADGWKLYEGLKPINVQGSISETKCLNGCCAY